MRHKFFPLPQPLSNGAVACCESCGALNNAGAPGCLTDEAPPVQPEPSISKEDIKNIAKEVVLEIIKEKKKEKEDILREQVGILRNIGQDLLSNLQSLSLAGLFSPVSLFFTSNGAYSLNIRCSEQLLSQQKVTRSPVGHNFSHKAVSSLHTDAFTTSSLSYGGTATTVASQRGEMNFYLSQAPEKTDLRRRHINEK